MAMDNGMGGCAFDYGMPGSIGVALRMNAGANGGDTSERVIEVHAVDRKGNRQVLTKAEMGYGYRHSAAGADLIFTHAVFEGYPDERAKIRAEMDAVRQHRETVQPVKEKTGGSTFKNPAGHSAWKVIRSEEHTSELQSLMRISYAVFCLKKKKKRQNSNVLHLT